MQSIISFVNNKMLSIANFTLVKTSSCECLDHLYSKTNAVFIITVKQAFVYISAQWCISDHFPCWGFVVNDVKGPGSVHRLIIFHH